MPELPEVETIRRGLEARIIGRTITSVRLPPDTGKPVPVIKGMEESAFREGVVGSKIEAVTRRGKYLILHLDSGMLLVVHLRMTGALLFPEAPEDPYVRAIFTFDNGEEMRFTDLRKFGGFWLVEDIGEVIRALGPEPFSDQFSVGTLAEALAGRKAPVKAVILDQRHIAGIGNIYADEACFAAGINPTRLALSLDDDEVAALHAAIRDVLQAGVDSGGASFKDYRNTTGNVGSMQTLVKVFRRTGKACYSCGATIERVKVGGRSTHYCPKCQR